MEFHTIFHSLEVYFSYAKDSRLVNKQTVSFPEARFKHPLTFLWQECRAWVICCHQSFMWWKMSQRHFGALLHWWNEWLPISIVTKMGCTPSFWPSLRYLWLTGLICWWRTSSLFLRMYCRSSSLSCQLNVNINPFAFSWPWRVLRYGIVSFPLKIEYFCRHTVGSFVFFYDCCFLIRPWIFGVLVLELWFFCHFAIWAAWLHVGCSFPLF